MKITKKILSLLLACFLVMSFSLVSFAEDTATDETVTEEATTYTVTLQPDNYASIYLHKGDAGTIAGGYAGASVKRNLLMYYNVPFEDNIYIYSRCGTILSEYTLPLREALTELGVTHYISKWPSNAKNGTHPIFYNLGSFSSGLNIKDGVHKGPTNYDGEDGTNEYNLIKEYVEANYWPLGYSKNLSATSLPWGSQIVHEFKGSSETTGARTKTVPASVLEKIKADKTSPVVTFATGRATSLQYSESAYGLYNSDQKPSLTATYSIEGLLNIVNTATTDTISKAIEAMSIIGLFKDSTAGADAYASLISVAKAYVDNEFINVIANGGFESLDEVALLYDEAVSYAKANGMLIAINGAESADEMKELLDDMANASYVSLSDTQKKYVARELFEKAQTNEYTLADDFYADMQVFIADVSTVVVGEIASGNDAMVYVTQHSSNTDRDTTRALKVHYNTLSPSGTTNHNAQWVSLISEFNIWNKNAIKKAEIGYTTYKGSMSGRNVPIFYDLKGFDMGYSAGTYDGPVAATDTAEAVEASDEYKKVMEFVNKYWPANNGYSSSASQLPLAQNMTNDNTAANTARNFYDVTTAITALKPEGENADITFATGRADHQDSNMRFKYEANSHLPTLKLSYDSDALVSFINSATDDEAFEDVIKTLGENGLLENSTTYKYAGYTGLGDGIKAIVREELLSLILSGGVLAFNDFSKAYDDAIYRAVNDVINNPDIYVTFDDETADNIKGETNDGTIHGTPSFIKSFNGSKALRIDNAFGNAAQQYVDFGEYDFSEGNFSIVFWMRAPERGILYEEAGDSIDSKITSFDFSTYTGTKGGVVLSNQNFSNLENIGFSFAALPIYADFAVNMKIGENDTTNKVGYQRPIDSRWHQISFVVNRGGNATVYVDDYAMFTSDISKLSGSLGKGVLTLGADALGQYGMMKGEFDEFKVYSSALEVNKISELYYMNAVEKVSTDMKNLSLSDNADLYTEADYAELNEKISALDSYISSYKPGNLDAIKAVFEENDTYFDNFLNRNVKSVAAYGSDIHISENNENHLSAQNLKRLLTESENWANPAKSFIFSGDLADVGADDLRYYFKYMTNWSLPGSNIVMCRGNHDEPSGSENDTGISYTKAQMLQKYIDGVEPFVNKEVGFNKALLKEGKLTQPYYYSTDGFAHYIAIDTYIPNLGEVTQAELSWARSVLEKISGDGKPIFWVQHPPLWGTFPYGRIENDKNQLKEKYDIQIKNILKDFDNIIVLNGHNHEAYESGAVRPASVNFADGTPTGAYQVNAPILASKSIIRGYEWAGGYYIHIYDDKVVFRARDFENQRWLRDYDVTVPLKAATRTPVVEAAGAYYDSLEEAVANAYDGDEIKLLANTDGNGIVIESGRKLTINLNEFTYTVSGDTVGSTGTQTNGFQLFNNSDITIKNGTIKADSDNLKMLIQNYANLTLDSVTLDCSDDSSVQYVLSVNNGTTIIKGNTNIIAYEGMTAFDSYYYPSAGYGETKVIVDETMTGKITGKVALSGDSGYELKSEISISAGTFTNEIKDEWCAFGFIPSVNADGTYTVAETKISVSEDTVSIQNKPEAYILILASYNGNKLIDTKTVSDVGEDNEITLAEAGLVTENASEIKAMLWKSLDALKPLCK